MLSTKCVLQIIYLMYTYKQDLALNNAQWLICHKTQLTKSSNIRSEPYAYTNIYALPLHIYTHKDSLAPMSICITVLYFYLRPGPKMLFQGDTQEGSDTFQWPVIERDRVGGLRLMIWDKVKVPLCHYSDAPEKSNLWTAWQLFPLDDD